MDKYKNFKSLLEYFITHLEHCVTGNISNRGYDKYFKGLVDSNNFKITWQGYNGDNIQKQMSKLGLL